MKKFACAALSTALLASMLAACGSSASTTPAASSADTSSDTGASSTEAAASTGAAADGSLHVAMNTDIQTMDVHKTNNDYMVPLNIFDRLFEIKTNADGSMDVWFGPKAPAGMEKNWVETIPGKGWFMILRLYGPLEPWFNKTWRPGEIEEVK